MFKCDRVHEPLMKHDLAIDTIDTNELISLGSEL